MQIMRVVHLSTTTSGGAGRAAVRSVDALNRNGVQATLLDRNSELKILKVKSPLRSFVISRTSTLITGLQSEIIQRGEELMTPLSLDILAMDEERIEFLRSFDVIHMHAFFNFFSIRKLQTIIPKVPKVVTLHDERLLTGGCHYATNCNGLQKKCAKCPKTRLVSRAIVEESKRRGSVFWSTKQSKGIRLILPSEWLKERVKQVPAFGNVSTSVINNCVPEAFFTSIQNRPHTRNNELRIGFVSTDLESPYKGFQFFAKAIEKFASTEEMKVTAVLISSGRRVMQISSNIEWQQLSPKNDKEYIASLDSVDVVCVPSAIDNSPNVVIEALARGIPVLASESGGTGEIPKQISLPTFNYGSVEDFCVNLNRLVRIGTLNRVQLETVRNLVSEETHAKNLINLYKSVI